MISLHRRPAAEGPASERASAPDISAPPLRAPSCTVCVVFTVGLGINLAAHCAPLGINLAAQCAPWENHVLQVLYAVRLVDLGKHTRVGDGHDLVLLEGKGKRRRRGKGEGGKAG